MKAKACVDHLGNIYGSRTEMYKHYNINQQVYNRRISRGWSIEKTLTTPVQRRKGSRTEVSDSLGNKYNSQNELSGHYGISRTTYYRLKKRGMTVEEMAQKRKIKDHLGNIYGSRAEMCKHYGISPALCAYRLKKGFSLQEALEGEKSFSPSKKYDHLGNEFLSISDMCKAWNIPEHVYYERNKLGWAIKDILTKPPRFKANNRLRTSKNEAFVDCLGNVFKTQKAASEYYKIPLNALRPRLNILRKTANEALYMPYKRHILNLPFTIGDFFMNGDMPYYCCTCEKCGYKGVLGLKEMIDHKCDNSMKK